MTMDDGADLDAAAEERQRDEMGQGLPAPVVPAWAREGGTDRVMPSDRIWASTAHPDERYL